MRYRTKPFEIEAIQFHGIGTNEAEIEAFGAKTQLVDTTISEAETLNGAVEKLQVTTLQVWDFLQETWVNVNPHDFVIKGMKGEYYPCEEEVFRAKYERT